MPRSRKDSSLPFLVMADEKGRVFEHPELRMLGAYGRRWRLPEPAEMAELPEGTDLYVLPNRHPVGWDSQKGQAVPVPTFGGRRVWAVSAFLPPAYTSLLWTAFIREHEAPPLPLYAYTALGWSGDRLLAPSVRVDPDRRQDLDGFPSDARENREARRAVREYPRNRLIAHLAHCCTVYRCPAARNLFLGRHEAPLPTARGCNARCVGCISLQAGGCIPSTQDRITFRPTAEEVAEVALLHISRAAGAVVSFGQGCEGEPLTEWRLLEAAIRRIRSATTAGTINLNTNGSKPLVIRKLFDAGLDSIRVSLNSAREEFYTRYFRPVNYRFRDVADTLRAAAEMGRFSSVNYFVFPGLTDEAAESEALLELWKETGFDMIQWRNLNMDPELYMEALDWDGGEQAMGMLELMDRIRIKMGGVRFGYFNPYLGGVKQRQAPG